MTRRLIKASAPASPETSEVVETERTADQVRASFVAMAKQLNASFVERDGAVTAIQLAMLCGFNYLLVGSHGTAKTALAECASKHIVGARFFSPSALGAYTTLGDLVGERDIPSLMQGVSRRDTRGKLASVELAFLDEIFKASDPTCNSLLALMNAGERKFDGGVTPLWSVGAATNWPEVLAQKPIVAAFWDRLHFRVVVESVQGEAQLLNMLRVGRSFSLGSYTPDKDARLTIDELRSIGRHLAQVAIPATVEKLLVHYYDRLTSAQVTISGRRLVEFQRILQASAWLAGRTVVSMSDFRHLLWCSWTTKGDIDKVRGILDTIDAEYVRKLSTSIADARTVYASYSRQGWDSAKANEFLSAAHSAVNGVVDAIESGSITTASQADLKRVAAMLRTEVKTVLEKFGGDL